ncbi:MAG: hypothetical protein ACWGPN_10220 [Gammaproteobacteria bacterium]
MRRTIIGTVLPRICPCRRNCPDRAIAEKIESRIELEGRVVFFDREGLQFRTLRNQIGDRAAGPPQNLDPRVPICCTNTTGISRRRPFTRRGERRIWEIAANDAEGTPHALYLDQFPRSLYDLPQISLDAGDVEQFRSLFGLPVYENDRGRVDRLRDGVTTNSSIMALQRVRAWTPIDEPRGWIRLPVVDAGPIAEFIGRMVYFLRGNWERARASFEAVARNENTPSSVRMDAAMLLAATEFRLDPACGRCEEAIDVARRNRERDSISEPGNAASRFTAKIVNLVPQVYDRGSEFGFSAPATRAATPFVSLESPNPGAENWLLHDAEVPCCSLSPPSVLYSSSPFCARSSNRFFCLSHDRRSP